MLLYNSKGRSYLPYTQAIGFANGLSLVFGRKFDNDFAVRVHHVHMGWLMFTRGSCTRTRNAPSRRTVGIESITYPLGFWNTLSRMFQTDASAFRARR